MDKPMQDFESYREKQLNVEPFYGWGWGNSRGEPAEVPEPFTITLKKLFTNRHNSLAGVGYISSGDHPLERRWVVFSQRHLGLASIARKGTHFNISVLVVPPGVDEDELASNSDILKSDEAVHGYGLVYIKE